MPDRVKRAFAVFDDVSVSKMMIGRKPDSQLFPSRPRGYECFSEQLRRQSWSRKFLKSSLDTRRRYVLASIGWQRFDGR